MDEAHRRFDFSFKLTYFFHFGVSPALLTALQRQAGSPFHFGDSVIAALLIAVKDGLSDNEPRDLGWPWLLQVPVLSICSLVLSPLCASGALPRPARLLAGNSSVLTLACTLWQA